MAFKKGLPPEKINEKNKQKGQYYRAPGDRISYIKKGVIKAFVPKDGKNRVRIVQPIEVEELLFWAMDMHFHRDVGDKGTVLFGDYLCNARMKHILKAIYPKSAEVKDMDGKCYQCDQQTSDLWDSNPELAKTYYPDERRWLLVNDLLSNDKEEVLLWSCPKTLCEEITSRSTNEETSVYLDVSDPTNGVPVSFERTGSGKLTKYINVQLFTEPLPLTEAIDKGRIKFIDVIVIPTYEEVGAAATDSEIGASKPEPKQEASQDDDQVGIEQEENVPPEDCYQKQFDEWQDCEECEWREPCENPPPPKLEKPAKKEKPARKQRVEKPAEAAGTEDQDAKKKAIRDQIAKKQKEQQGA